ncbi:MAG: NAD(+) synthase [Bacteroidales bacterium]|nr:NAD(+) synthase [Bacteroidales bacterium]
MFEKCGGDVGVAYRKIREKWTRWADEVGASRWVVGISGGKDSTVVAALAADFFGTDAVYGVKMPNGVQKDIDDSNRVISITGIHDVTVNIGPAFESIISSVADRIGKHRITNDAKINLPPRLRMATLYAVAQSVNGMVLNTSNASELFCGYGTLWGDVCGGYGPLRNLTVSEVVALGDYIGLPRDLVHKTPSDGLSGESDEQRLGVSYEDIDAYLTYGPQSVTLKAAERIEYLHKANKYKGRMIHVDAPEFFG